MSYEEFIRKVEYQIHWPAILKSPVRFELIVEIDMNKDWFLIWKESIKRYILSSLFWTYMEYWHHEIVDWKKPGWNLEFGGEYQSFICRWPPPLWRKWRQKLLIKEAENGGSEKLANATFKKMKSTSGPTHFVEMVKQLRHCRTFITPGSKSRQMVAAATSGRLYSR